MAPAQKTVPDADLLRIYWYDAAPDQVHTVEQREFAALAGVKVRLGRLTSHAQKLVDARLRDLGSPRDAAQESLVTGPAGAGGGHLPYGVGLPGNAYAWDTVPSGVEPVCLPPVLSRA